MRNTLAAPNSIQQENVAVTLARDSATAGIVYTGFGGTVSGQEIFVIQKKETAASIDTYTYCVSGADADFDTFWTTRAGASYTATSDLRGLVLPSEPGTSSGGAGGSVTVSNFPADYPSTTANSLLGEQLGALDALYTQQTAQAGNEGTSTPVPDSVANGSGYFKWFRWIYERLSNNTSTLGTLSGNVGNAGTGITNSADTALTIRAILDGVLQTATLDNTSTANSVFGTFDTRAFSGVVFTCVSTSGALSVLIEHSHDLTLWQVAGEYFTSANGAGQTKQNGSVAASVSAGRMLLTPVLRRYIRIRVSTTGVGTSVWAARFIQANPFVYEMDYNRTDIQSMAQSGTWSVRMQDGNGNLTGSGYTANGSGLKVNAGIKTTNDVVSGALVSTTTTSALLQECESFCVMVRVTAFGGTNPYLWVCIQESMDGSSWRDLYWFPKILGNYTCYSPMLQSRGQIRIYQEVGGTGPSFTRQIWRTMSSKSVRRITNLVNYNLAIGTLNATTAALDCGEDCGSFAVTLGCSGGATAPVLTLEMAEDQYGIWTTTSFTITGALSSNVMAVSASNLPRARFARLKVTTAATGGTSVTLLELKAIEI